MAGGPTTRAADGYRVGYQASASSCRVSWSSSGSVLVCPMIGMKFWSPGPARHHVLVQVRGDPGAGDRALVHPDVEAVHPGDLAQGLPSRAWSATAISAASSTVVSV